MKAYRVPALLACAALAVALLLGLSFSGDDIAAQPGSTEDAVEAALAQAVSLPDEYGWKFRESDPPDSFIPRGDDAYKNVYDLVFYPPGKAPAGELEYDPVPFEDLLPSFGESDLRRIYG